MIGKIHSIKGKTVFIVLEESACFGCMNHKCKNHLIATKNRLHLDLAPGQRIETKTGKMALFQQTLTVLLPPLAGFVVGFLLVRALFPASADSACAAGGVALMFAASLITYIARKRYPAKCIPYITRVLGDDYFTA